MTPFTDQGPTEKAEVNIISLSPVVATILSVIKPLHCHPSPNVQC